MSDHASRPDVLLATLPAVLGTRNLRVPPANCSPGEHWGPMRTCTYFMEVLANPAAHTHLGNALFYSTDGAAVDEDSRAEVYVTDGLNRLASVVLGSMAVRETLESIAEDGPGGAAKRARMLLERDGERLDLIARCNLEVSATPDRPPVPLGEFIRRTAALQSSVESSASTQDAKIVPIWHNQRTARDSSVWRAYESLGDALRDPQPGSSSLLACFSFLKRLPTFTLTVTCMVPDGDCFDFERLQHEAFAVSGNGHFL